MIKSIETNNGKTTNHENSGTEGVGVEELFSGMVTVCMELQSLSLPIANVRLGLCGSVIRRLPAIACTLKSN
jgi:hypothetical protein